MLEVELSQVQLHTVVALMADIPEQGLIRGQVGTVVEIWQPGVYEVEFSDDQGAPYAFAALREEQLLILHHSPARAAV